MKKSIAAVIISITLISLTACSDSSNQMIELTQKANSSAGKEWQYCLSNEDVIREIDYYETRFFLSPGYTQHWKFEVINDGIVTIHWTAYHGSNESEKDSYDVTYCVSDGNLSIVSE